MDEDELREFVMTAPERHKALFDRLLSDRAIKALLRERPAASPDTSPAAPRGTPESAV